MRKRRTEKDNGATAARLAKLDGKVARKQRQIRENLRRNRDAYWTEVAEQLEKAYGDTIISLLSKHTVLNWPVQQRGASRLLDNI